MIGRENMILSKHDGRMIGRVVRMWSIPVYMVVQINRWWWWLVEIIAVHALLLTVGMIYRMLLCLLLLLWLIFTARCVTSILRL